jgi:hypothetical protein
VGLQDELRKAVAADDVPKVHDILDRIAAQYRAPFEKKLAAIKAKYGK